MKISAVIITNREKLDGLLLRSLSFVDEIVIVRDSSTDYPEKKSPQQKKTRTFYHPLNGDFSAQRNFALKKATGDWVLFVDDDEYVGTELASEIRATIQDTPHAGFRIPRRDVVFHRPMLFGETGQTRLLRLARRTSGKFIRPVHETWKIKGGVGELSSPLYHTKDHFISGFLSRMSEYGEIDAGILSREGKPFSWFRLLFFPIGKFKLNYFFRAGFLDGLPGLFLSYLMAVQSLTVRVLQWQNQK